MCSACTSVNSKGLAMSAGAGRARSRTPRIGGDDRVDHVEGLEQALDDVRTVARLLAGGTPSDGVMTSTWCAT